MIQTQKSRGSFFYAFSYNVGKTLFLLNIFLVLGILFSTPAIAQIDLEDNTNAATSDRLKEPDKVVKLYSGLIKEPLLPFAYIVEDPRSDLNYRDVYNRFKRGSVSSYDENRETMTFGLSGKPAWVVLGLHNVSGRDDEFILSLTGGHFQTQGLVEEMQVFEVRENQGERRDETEPYFSVKLSNGEFAVLMIYIEPAGNWPVTIRPHIYSAQTYMESLEARSSYLVPLLYLFFGIGLAAIIVTAFQNFKVGLFAVAFILFVIMINLASLPHMTSELLSNMTYPYLYTGIILFAAIGLILQNGIRLTDKNEMISIGLPFCLTILTNVLAHFIPAGFGLLNILFITIAPLLLCLSLIVVTLVFYQLERSPALWWAMWMWVCLMLSLVFFVMNGVEFYLALIYIPVWLPYLFLFLSMMSMVVYTVSNEELFLSDLSSGFTKVSSTIRGLRAAEEAGEYERLLMVVKRERQIMAELREKDMRRRKEMQKAKESADEANRAKSAFLAVISHEIRTPMSGIMGLVRLLTNTPLSEEQKKYARTILDSGESMTALLNDILDFEKIESGKMVLEEVDFEIDQVIHSASMLMAGHAKNKNIKLIASIDSQLPSVYVGDPSRLRQVILNLVGNAIKFTEEGAVYITVTRNQNVSNEDQGKMPLSISVRDSGIGIPQEALVNLFDPFAQADKSTSRLYGGSGLGLAICKRLIEAMGGTITVESEVGEGSIFRINVSVPINNKSTAEFTRAKEPVDYTQIFEENEEGGAASSTSSEEGSAANEALRNANTDDYGSVDEDAVNDIFQLQAEEGINILVVEDNEINQQVLVDFLKPYTKEIAQSLTAEDGLENCREKEFDIIFMDWELPGMNGPQAIKELRMDDTFPSHATPAVLLTGHNVSLAETGLEPEEVTAILTKPVSPEQLRDMIYSVYPNLKQQMRRKVVQQESTPMKEDPLVQAEPPISEAPAPEEPLEYSPELPEQVRSEYEVSPENIEAEEPLSGDIQAPEYSENEEQKYDDFDRNLAEEASPEQIVHPVHHEQEPAEHSDEGEYQTEYTASEYVEATETDTISPTSGDESASPSQEQSASITAAPLHDDDANQGSDDLSMSPFYSAQSPGAQEYQPQPQESTYVPAPQEPSKPAEPAGSGWPEDIFNPDMLKSLLGTLGEDKIMELMKSVVEKSDEILADMNTAIGEKDVRLLMQKAHELKGMTGNFAMSEIQTRAEIIEKAVKNGADDFGPQMKSLNKALDRVKEFMDTTGNA